MLVCIFVHSPWATLTPLFYLLASLILREMCYHWDPVGASLPLLVLPLRAMRRFPPLSFPRLSRLARPSEREYGILLLTSYYSE